MSSVLQSLADVADSKWVDGEGDSYYSDEECEDEVDVTLASKGLSECGFVQDDVGEVSVVASRHRRNSGK